MTYKSVNSQDVILASQAAWRSAVLNQLNIRHRQVNHKFVEPEFQGGSLERFIEKIAREKASSLGSDYPDSIIIAADQLVCIDKVVLYKSGTKEKAIAQLEMLNGKKHRLICAVAVLFQNRIETTKQGHQLPIW